jgi:hypothetical protein
LVSPVCVTAGVDALILDPEAVPFEIKVEFLNSLAETACPPEDNEKFANTKILLLADVGVILTDIPVTSVKLPAPILAENKSFLNVLTTCNTLPDGRLALGIFGNLASGSFPPITADVFCVVTSGYVTPMFPSKIIAMLFCCL